MEHILIIKKKQKYVAAATKLGAYHNFIFTVNIHLNYIILLNTLDKIPFLKCDSEFVVRGHRKPQATSEFMTCVN